MDSRTSRTSEFGGADLRMAVLMISFVCFCDPGMYNCEYFRQLIIIPLVSSDQLIAYVPIGEPLLSLSCPKPQTSSTQGVLTSKRLDVETYYGRIVRIFGFGAQHS